MAADRRIPINANDLHFMVDDVIRIVTNKATLSKMTHHELERIETVVAAEIQFRKRL